MGLKTLANFREDLQLALGNRGFTEDQLDNWINTGYQDLVSQKDLEEQELNLPETMLAGVNILMPTTVDPEGILDMVNLTDKIAMTRVEHQRWVRLDQTLKGKPKHWYRRGVDILVWPTPEVDTNVSFELQSSLGVLANPGDTTPLQAMWDRAIHILAMFHSLTDLEEPNRAGYFLQVSQQYIAKRIDLRETDGRATGMPVQPIDSFAQLRKQQEFDTERFDL